MRWRIPIALAALALSLGAPASRAETRPPTDTLAASDFVTRALRSAERHKPLLALAVERAENPKVKRLAEAVARDLDENIQKLNAMARSHEREVSRPLADVGAVPEIPADEVPYKRPQYQRLRSLFGQAFDKQFISGLVLGYENALRRYDAEAANGDDATRRFVDENLPRLRARLDEAKALRDEIDPEPR